MLKGRGVPNAFWREAVTTAVFLLNRSYIQRSGWQDAVRAMARHVPKPQEARGPYHTPAPHGSDRLQASTTGTTHYVDGPELCRRLFVRAIGVARWIGNLQRRLSA
jgi:hypothetical protein